MDSGYTVASHWAHEVFFFANLIAVQRSPLRRVRARPKGGTDRHATPRSTIITSDATTWYNSWPERPKRGLTTPLIEEDEAQMQSEAGVSSHSCQDRSAPQLRTPTSNTVPCAAD